MTRLDLAPQTDWVAIAIHRLRERRPTAGAGLDELVLRNIAILSLIDAGLDPARVATLRGTDLEYPPAAELRVVLSRGAHSEVLTLTPPQHRALSAYLAATRRFGRPVPLWHGRRGPLTARGLANILRTLRRRYGGRR